MPLFPMTRLSPLWFAASIALALGIGLVAFPALASFAGKPVPDAIAVPEIDGIARIAGWMDARAAMGFFDDWSAAFDGFFAQYERAETWPTRP